MEVPSRYLGSRSLRGSQYGVGSSTLYLILLTLARYLDTEYLLPRYLS